MVISARVCSEGVTKISEIIMACLYKYNFYNMFYIKSKNPKLDSEILAGKMTIQHTVISVAQPCGMRILRKMKTV